MLHSVFFALMVGSPTHPPLLAPDLLPHPPHRPVPCPHPPTPPPDRGMHHAPVPQYRQPGHICLAFTVYWKQPAWLHMPCPRVGAWT